MHILRFVFIFILSVSPQILSAQLQWEKIGSFSSRIQLVYFTDEMHGFVSIGTVPGSPTVSPKLFRTSDGGLNWTVASVDKLNSGFGIQDMFMTDSLNGWLCGGCNQGYSLWRTYDGGINWNTVGSADNRYSVAIRKTAAGIVVSDFYNQHIRISKDDGITFQDVFKPAKDDVLLGMDFVDELHGALIGSFRAGNPWYYTSDGGETWKGTTVNMESWSMYGQKGSSNFFVAPEGFSDKGYVKSPCYRSTDFGQTWKIICVLPIQTVGHITGVGTALYVQSEFPTDNTAGVYRSLDSGMTWQWLGGPNGYGDTRFIAVPVSCHKTVIFAEGDDFNLYKAYDDKGGTASNSVSGVLTKYQSAAIIHPGDTANVQINIHFPTVSKAIGFIPTEAEYSIYFDPSVVEPSRASDIHPPDGWMKKLVTISNDSVDVLLADTSGIAITADQNFGSVGFFALSTAKPNVASVTFSTLKLRNDCAEVIGVPDKETGVLRMIGVETSGVTVADLSEKKLRLYPNPATEEINISFDAIRDHQAEIIILDALGKNVLHRNIPIQPSTIYSLSIKTLTAGSYTLIVNAAALTLSEKFEAIK